MELACEEDAAGRKRRSCGREWEQLLADVLGLGVCGLAGGSFHRGEG